MKYKLIILATAMLFSYPALASHTIGNSGKSAQRFLVTDMFWSGSACAGVDISGFQITAPPQNGTVTQRAVKEKLNSAKLNISPPNRCEGQVIPISYVYYQSKKGFKGTDTFSVRWTSAGGDVREKTYTVTVD
jgi:hypothetical protein